jgi:predicted 2-oxoglutarate/Fe(II)-dependent dioxygenase YbiX
MVNYVNGLFPGDVYPTQTFAGALDVFKDVWPETQETIAMLEKECSSPESGMSWKKAKTFIGEPGQTYRTNYDLNLSSAALELNNPVAQNIHNQFYTLLLASMSQYVIKHDLHDLPMIHEGYNLLKYSGGQEYKAHYDGSTGTGRTVSAILYLNSDFEGGEVEFVNFNLKIKPEPGMLLLFPSNYAYRHIAHPVTSGTKYAAVTWIKDRVING